MSRQIIKALDEALGATLNRDELARFSQIELGRRHAFLDNVSQGTYPNQRIEYITFLERQGKLNEFIKYFLEKMESNSRPEIADLKNAVDEAERQPEVPKSEPAPSPPPPSSGGDMVQQVRLLVGRNKLKEALNALEAKANGDSDLYEGVILLKAQLSSLERDEMMGVINYEQSGIRRARISSRILSLAR